MQPESPAVTIARRRFLLLAGAAATLQALTAPTLSAQGPGVFEMYIARNQALTDSPLFGGIGLAGYSGPFGIRVNGALHLERGNAGARALLHRGCYGGCTSSGGRRAGTGMGLSDVRVGAWTADLDLMFAPLRGLRGARTTLGFSPYGFAGIGGIGDRMSGALDTTIATWSLGGGAQLALGERVGIQGQARRRQPLGQQYEFASGAEGEWEYRIGLAVNFGGRSARPRRDRTPPPSRPLPGRRGPSRRPSPPVVMQPEPAAPRPRLAARVLDDADALVGTNYRYGGTDATEGFDAPGFVQFVFAKEGVRLPRTSREIARVGEDVPLDIDALRPGDLLFFANDGSRIDHVAIYAGHGRIIHSSASGGGVRYDVLDEGERGAWFADHLVAVRRLTDDGDRSMSRDVTELDPPDRAPKPARRP